MDLLFSDLLSGPSTVFASVCLLLSSFLISLVSASVKVSDQPPRFSTHTPIAHRSLLIAQCSCCMLHVVRALTPTSPYFDLARRTGQTPGSPSMPMPTAHDSEHLSILLHPSAKIHDPSATAVLRILVSRLPHCQTITRPHECTTARPTDNYIVCSSRDLDINPFFSLFHQLRTTSHQQPLATTNDYIFSPFRSGAPRRAARTPASRPPSSAASTSTLLSTTCQSASDHLAYLQSLRRLTLDRFLS